MEKLLKNIEKLSKNRVWRANIGALYIVGAYFLFFENSRIMIVGLSIALLISGIGKLAECILEYLQESIENKG
jgi:hypothetical protein